MRVLALCATALLIASPMAGARAAIITSEAGTLDPPSDLTGLFAGSLDAKKYNSRAGEPGNRTATRFGLVTGHPAR